MKRFGENANIKKLVVCYDYLKNNQLNDFSGEIVEVNTQVFDTISEVKNPQGVLAVVDKNVNNCEIDYSENLIVALDDVQDPGNIGTILRTVDSIGISQIIVSKGSADVYNSKVIRSTMGAIFRIKVIECDDIAETLKTVKKNGFKVVSSILETDKTIYEIDYNKKVIVIGNEGNGISEEVVNISDEKVKIPMLGRTESLNASVATGIILYEYVRQNFNK